jgi:DnaJ domain
MLTDRAVQGCRYRLLRRMPQDCGAIFGLRNITQVQVQELLRSSSTPVGRAFSTAARDHYAVLGVPPNASPKEIKAAFYRAAKNLHPDAAKAAGKDSTAAFVQLSISYELLSNPVERAKYDQERISEGFPSSSFWASRTAQGAQGGDQHDDTAASSDVSPAFEEDPDRLFGGLGGISRRAYEQGADSVWAKLKEAHLGPQFFGTASDWPYAFECDERNDAGASHDISRIVLGQRLLGVVRGRVLTMIADGKMETHQQLPSWLPSLVGEAAQGRGKIDKQNVPPPSQAVSYSALELWWLGKHLATAKVLPRSAVPGSTVDDEEVDATSGDQDEGNPYRRMVIGIFRGRDAGKCAVPPDEAKGDDAHNEPSPEEAIFGDFDPSATSFNNTSDDEESRPVAYILPSEGLNDMYLRRVVVCSLVERSEEMRKMAAASAPSEASHKAGPSSSEEANQKEGGREEEAAAPTESSRSRPNPESPTEQATDAANVRGSVAAAASLEKQQQREQKEKERRELLEMFPHLRDEVDEDGTSTLGPGPARHRRLGYGQNYRPVDSGRRAGSGDDGHGLSFFTSLFHDGYDQRPLRGGPSHREPPRHPGPEPSSKAKQQSSNSEGQQQQKQQQQQQSPTRAPGQGIQAKTAPWAAPHWNQSRPWRSIGDGSGPDVPSFRMSPLLTASSTRSSQGSSSKIKHPMASPEFSTHTLIVFRTPGVSHLRWMRNFDMALEAKGSRVRLPSSDYWLWAAASPAHQHGGFYFELSRRRKVEWWKKPKHNGKASASGGEKKAASSSLPPIDTVCHPSIYCLTAAVMTLEREWEQEMKLQEKTLLGSARRLWDKLGRGGRKDE